MQAHCLNINNLEHKLHVIHGSLSISLEKNAIKIQINAIKTPGTFIKMKTQ